MHDELGDAAADGRRLLQPVAGEAVAEIKVRDLGGRPDDGVVVEEVHVVGAGPGAARPDRLEGRHAMRKRRPDPLLEERPVDLLGRGIVVVPARVRARRRGGPADKPPALRRAPAAGVVDEEGKPREPLGAGEAEHRGALGRHRNLDAGERRQRAPAGTGAIRDRAAGDRGSVGEAGGGDAPAVTVEADDAPGPVFGAERAGLAAARLPAGPTVQATLAAAAPRAAGEVPPPVAWAMASAG